jgi:hypothetical protein
MREAWEEAALLFRANCFVCGVSIQKGERAFRKKFDKNWRCRHLQCHLPIVDIPELEEEKIFWASSFAKYYKCDEEVFLTALRSDKNDLNAIESQICKGRNQKLARHLNRKVHWSLNGNESTLVENDCFLTRKFGASRFLSIASSLNDQDKKLKFEIDFGGRSFRWFCNKKGGRKSREVVSYFFAVENINCHQFHPKLPRVTIDDLICSLGGFPVDITPLKLNTRLLLGLSTSLACCSIDESSIKLYPDIPCDGSLGGIMTDGCGLISVSSICTYVCPIYDMIYDLI